jgi:hypothetical protein
MMSTLMSNCNGDVFEDRDEKLQTSALPDELCSIAYSMQPPKLWRYQSEANVEYLYHVIVMHDAGRSWGSASLAIKETQSLKQICLL